MNRLQYLALVLPAVVLYGSGAYELGFVIYLVVAIALPVVALCRRLRRHRMQRSESHRRSVVPAGRTA